MSGDGKDGKMGMSKIEWTDYTFNAWRGCSKVSPCCDHCYAERYSVRQPDKFGTWGPNGKRVIAAESTWRQPLAWNRAAERAGERRLVFCGSLMDFFEERAELMIPRARVVELIDRTPHLDWLLLTNRPENVLGLWPGIAMPVRANVWLGVTVGNQEWAERRIPELLKLRATVRFVNYEPALGPLDARKWIFKRCPNPKCRNGRVSAGFYGDQSCSVCRGTGRWPGIDWLIAGGESGPGARPAHPEWFRQVRDQCCAAGVPFFFTQWGELGYLGHLPEETVRGLDAADAIEDYDAPYRVGKKAAGRLLDGRTWDQIPATKG